MSWSLRLLIVVTLLLGVVDVFAGDLPDAVATPGAVNASVTQANIKSTICVSGWTKTIRPSASYTDKLKAVQLKSGTYKSSLPMTAFEEDHLISLEIGGNPRDPKNLWPQHWSAPYGAHQKDELENYLHKSVCNGSLKLVDAQTAASKNWVEAYKRYIKK